MTLAAIADGRKMLRSLALGFTLVLAAQLVLNLSGAEIDPTTIGTTEQRFWDAAAALKAVASWEILVAILFTALFLSVAVNSLAPLAVSKRIRKGVSQAAAVIVAASLFTFVTAESGERRLADVTERERLRLAQRLATLAGDRRAAIAYAWAAASVEETARRRPEAVRDWRAYFEAGSAKCDLMEAEYKQGVVIPSRVLEDAFTGIGLIRRNLEHRIAIGETMNITKKPSNSLCEERPLLAAMMRRLRPAQNKALASEPPRIWVPEFARHLTVAVWLPDPSTPIIEPLRLNRLIALRDEIEREARDAATVRSEARSLAIKSAKTLIGDAFKFDGVAGEVADLLRDVALDELAKLGEARSKQLLTAVARRDGGPSAHGAAWLLAISFPDPVLTPVATNAKSSVSQQAEAAWSELHPGVTTVEEARLAAEAQVRLERTSPTPYADPRPAKPGTTEEQAPYHPPVAPIRR